MKKRIYVASGCAAAVALLVVLAVRVEAQQQGRRVAPNVLTLEGLGSSVGLRVRDADADELRKAGVSVVVVLDVRDGTPAAKAGVRESDLVSEFDGERVRSASQFARLVRETSPGRTVKMTVLRDGNRQVLDITPEQRGATDFALPDVAAQVERGLRNLPRDFQFYFDTPGRGAFFFPSPRRLGVAVSPLSEQLASYFGVKQGVLVSEVEPDSPAASAGVKAGDVITTINGQPVQTPGDVVRLVGEAQSGSSVEIHVTRDRRDMALTAKMPERPRRPTVTGSRPV